MLSDLITRALIAAKGPLTGVALAEAVGVSQPRASQVIRQLAEQTAVRATDDGYVGRPAKLLHHSTRDTDTTSTTGITTGT